MQISRKMVSGVTLTLLWIGIPILLFNDQLAHAEPMTIIVPDDYPTIQGAINAARHADIVYVKAGTYLENIVVNKSVSIIGENPSGTVIDGSESGDVVIINANDVSIANFTLRRSGKPKSGIRLESVKNCTIKNNNVVDNAWGVYLYNSFNDRVTNNNITASNFDGVYVFGSFDNTIFGNNIVNNSEHGIGLYKASNNSVSGNNIAHNNKDGIWIENSTNNRFSENNVEANRWDGILLGSFSSNNTIYGNNMATNERGVVLQLGALNNKISRNNVTANNLGGIIVGASSSSNSIAGNNVSNNAVGIEMHSSSNNTLSENTLKDNDYNLDIEGSTLDHFVQSIDTSNLVDGKSVYYLVDQKDISLSSATYPQVGYLALIKSTNVTAKDLTLTNNGQGLLLAYTNNSRIINSNVTGNEQGMFLYHSWRNEIIENDVEFNGKEGINLLLSSDNNISKNSIANNRHNGLFFDSSSNNSLYGNTVSNNLLGFSFLFSSNARLRGNVMIHNKYTFDINGYRLADFIHDIDISNTVDGKPIYYLTNQSGLLINPSAFPNVGYLALVNSTNVAVEGLELNGASGILLAFTNNSEIKNSIIENNLYGISLYTSFNNTVSGNRITNNSKGVALDWYSSRNSIFGDDITHNEVGVTLGYFSSNNTVYENNIANNEIGAYFFECFNNTFYHNNFVNNTQQTFSFFFDLHKYNAWDSDYPSGGNYWSDYTGVDEKSGPDQNQLGSDGMGDTPYVIGSRNQDNYPLMIPWSPLPIKVFNVFWENSTYSVVTLSNSTVTYFIFNQTLSQISFSVSGVSGTIGYCNITIPNSLMRGNSWAITIDGMPISFVESANETHSFLYFIYQHEGIGQVIIQGTWVVAEFPSIMILSLLMLISALVVALARRRLREKLKDEIREFHPTSSNLSEFRVEGSKL